eukprot:2659159-Alexandrium_andersonii.AAC.1
MVAEAVVPSLQDGLQAIVAELHAVQQHGAPVGVVERGRARTQVLAMLRQALQAGVVDGHRALRAVPIEIKEMALPRSGELGRRLLVLLGQGLPRLLVLPLGLVLGVLVSLHLPPPLQGIQVLRTAANRKG